MRTARVYGYGRFLRVRLRAGEPVMSPPPQFMRTMKYGNQFTEPQVFPSGDFIISIEWAQLFWHFDTVRDLTISVIHIAGGQPRSSEQSEALV